MIPLGVRVETMGLRNAPHSCGRETVSNGEVASPLLDKQNTQIRLFLQQSNGCRRLIRAFRKVVASEGLEQ